MSRLLNELPEVFVSDKSLSALVSQAVTQGQMRKIGSRLYTKNLEDDPVQIVKRNWHFLLKEYYSDALISDRTALEHKPAKDGAVFIVSSKKRSIRLPGMVFKPRKGSGPIETDHPFIHGLRISSEPRAFLENMRSSRSRTGSVSRTLSQKEIEDRLDKLFRIRGEDYVNSLRDKARVISSELNMQKEFAELEDLIGSMQGTRKKNIITATAKARRNKQPYDPGRLEVFLHLFEVLSSEIPPERKVRKLTSTGRVNISFFEAYFSNYIEGTEFSVEEAEEIVFQGSIPPERPEDAHDVLETWKVVSNYRELARTPGSFKDFIHLLKYRHAEIMSMRKNKKPGEFKDTMNVAGATQFVHPELVGGTLKKGYEIAEALKYPFQKAVFMMFLVSEVHPFHDGNGRVARIMMNAELVSAKEQKIIIPTVFRNNYITALKALTHNKKADPLLRTLDFAQKYTNAIDWNDINTAKKQLKETNAFSDPAEADLEGIRLGMI